MKTFQVNDEDLAKIDSWLKETVYPSIIAHQKENNPKPSDSMQRGWDRGIPYRGAIGGGLTYHFTPTSIGTAFRVSYGAHYELDL